MKNTTTSRNDSDGIRSLVLAVAASAGAAMIALQLAGCATSGAQSIDSSGSEEGYASSTETFGQNAETDVSSDQGFQGGWYDDLDTQESPEVTNVDFDEQSNAAGNSLPFATSNNTSAMRESMYAPYAVYNGFGGNTQNAGNIAQVSFTEVGSDFDADVDRTGTFMVYASTQHDHDSDIYRKSIDGRTTTQLTNDPGHDLMPEISPDGSKIAFTSNRNGNWDVFVMPISGGPAMQITSDSANELHPTWSPDGSAMAYCRFNQRTEQWEIWTVDCNQPSACSFVCEGMFPRWSSAEDVDRLLFQRARKRGEQLFGIWTIELHDGGGHNPTEILSAGEMAIMHPTWSPDGSRIAFTAVPDPSNTDNDMPMETEIWTVDLYGTSRTVLSAGGFRNMRPTWGANGRVFFTSNRTGIDNIWSVSDGIEPFGEQEMASVEAYSDQDAN